jgi:hypothetical protein
MRFQAPQFVDIKDKVIGPLTLKQFLIYLFAVLALVPVYLTVSLSFFITLAIPVLGVAAMFAHFRLHSKSLFQVFVNAVNYLFRGRLFIWRRTGMGDAMPVGLEEAEFLEEGEESRLGALARSLATEGKLVKDDVADPLAAS